jgi:phenylalanyl-tRNA synthetase beta chain
MPVERDLAFVAPIHVRAADIVKAAQAADRSLIAAAKVFDVYEGQGVPSGHKSVAIAVTLQPRERSLTDAEIDSIVSRIVAEVAKKTGAALRG